jgi:phosphoribosylformylglycinamidine synthase subunit PurS
LKEMQKWLASIRVTLKPVVNDPPGLAIRDALHNLGHEGVKAVRSGKYLQVYLSAADENEARNQIDTMCQRLLANPVIEDYAFDLKTVEEFPSVEA